MAMAVASDWPIQMGMAIVSGLSTRRTTGFICWSKATPLTFINSTTGSPSAVPAVLAGIIPCALSGLRKGVVPDRWRDASAEVWRQSGDGSGPEGGPKMTYVLLGIIVLVVLYVVYLYNNLIVLRNRIDNAWSQIDVQLRRRYDLIPNLVETVKGYATHEREVFERVTAARSRAIAAGSVGEQSQAENMITQALRRLFAVAEAYPQ